MKATDGNLRIDQSYKYISCEYRDRREDGLGAELCQNCGKLITNIAVVQGVVDEKIYRIGLDCAATLTGITPDEIAQAKKNMRNEAKLIKWIKTDCKMGILDETGEYVSLYNYEPRKWSANRHYDVRLSKRGELLKLAGVKIVSLEELRQKMLIWIVTDCKTAKINDGYITLYSTDDTDYSKRIFFEPDAKDIRDALAKANITLQE